MKAILIIALALFVTAYTYEVDDIPEFMRERLDKFVELRKKWEQKWLEMTPEEREFFEKMLYARLSHIPDSVKLRIHEKIEGMEAEDRTKLKNYLLQRFTELKPVEAENEVEELDGIIEQLPELIREKISDFIAIRFAPAAAYQSVIFFIILTTRTRKVYLFFLYIYFRRTLTLLSSQTSQNLSMFQCLMNLRPCLIANMSFQRIYVLNLMRFC